MSLSKTFIQAKFELKFQQYFPKPSYHPQNPDVVIISTSYYEGSKKGIYEYNLIQNTFNKIYTYDETFYPLCHAQFMDSKNELLYIFGGPSATFGVFDLNTKIMNTDTESVLRDCRRYPKSTYVPSPINEYHILSYDSIHYVMDMNNKNINRMKINKLKNNNIKLPNILYIPFTNQLISFGSYKSDRIWYCNINQISNKHTYDWQLYHLKMPYSTNDSWFDILLAFNNIIFIFYYIKNSHHDIWCFDLLNNKLIKTKYNTPKFSYYGDNIYVMKDNNNGCIMNFGSSEHFKCNLHNLVPKEVIKSHQTYYKPLIIGYIKQQENDNEFCNNIPYALKLLILCFFPLFT